MNTEIVQASRDFMAAADSASTLLNLTAAQTQLLVLLHEVEDDTWSSEERAALEQRLEEVNAALLVKSEAYAGLIRSLEWLEKGDTEELARITARRERKRRTIEWLRGRLLAHVKDQPDQRLETQRFSLSVRQNPPRVEVLDAAAVPSEYTRTKITVDVDKKAVLDAYKRDGEIVPGTEVVRGVRLDIS